MISRRRFLEVGSVTAGLAVASHSLVAATRRNKNDASLPPSMAQLKSRKSEATPITRDERRDTPGTRPPTDDGERARRDRADGRHVAALLHRHPLVGRRAHLRAGAAREGRGVLRVPGLRRRTGARADSPTRPTATRPTCAYGRRTRARTSASRKV